MKIQAFESFAPAWFTPDDQDVDDGAEVAFFVRPLDGEQYAEVAQHMRLEGHQMRFTAAAEKLALRYGLVDWRNLRTPGGDLVEYALAEHKRLPFVVRKMIFAEIMKRSELSEDDEKNLESPSRLPEIRKASPA